MGVHGMSPKGFTTPNLAEAETNRAFANTTSDVIILADHSKWNLNGLCTIMPLGAAALVITDVSLRRDARDVLTRECRNVQVVDPNSMVNSDHTATVTSRSDHRSTQRNEESSWQQ
jgi:DeoR/GlpR family transcriptional regulator of sugar metabolism